MDGTVSDHDSRGAGSHIPPVRDPRGIAGHTLSARAQPNASGLFSRIVLAASGVVFVGFGVAFLLWPSRMALRVGIPLVTMTGTTDVRAIYGGMEIGFGAFMLIASARRAWVLPGLVAALCALAAMALSRALGIALDGGPDPLTSALLASEVSGAAITLLALLVERRGSRGAPMAAPGQKSKHQTPSAAASHMPDP